jgi:hypothetical protein
VATASTPGKPHSDACGLELGISYGIKHAMQWGIVKRLQLLSNFFLHNPKSYDTPALPLNNSTHSKPHLSHQIHLFILEV